MTRDQRVQALALILLIGLFAAGCDKNKDRIIIEGTVSDAMESTPLEAADVYLFGKVLEGGIYNPNPTVIAVVSTNAGGEFEMDIQQVKASDFVLVISKDNYFDYIKPLTIDEISSGNAYEAAAGLHPVGWLKLQVQNTNPDNSSDLISYRIISDNPACGDCCNSDWKQGQGTSYHVESTCRSKAGTQAKVLWNVHKGTTHKTDSVMIAVPRFDTAFYHLKY